MEDENKLTPEAEETNDTFETEQNSEPQAPDIAQAPAQPEEPEEAEMSELTEELTEEEREVLAEQDSLDGADLYPSEEDSDQAVESKLSDVLEDAVISGKISAEEAQAIHSEVLGAMDNPQANDLPVKKSKKLIAALCCSIGVLLVALAALISYIWVGHNKDKQWDGLTLGKDYSKYVTLADYSALTYTDTYKEPTDADVMKEIHGKMSDYSKTEQVTDAIITDDVANIDFDGYIDDEKNDSACGTKHDLTIGSGSFIPGFEDGLIGHKAGESVTLNLTFPEDYSNAPELAGKAVRFEVKINKVTRTTYEELTADIVKKLSDDAYNTVDGYKDSIRAGLEESAKTTADNNAKNEIWQTIVNGSVLKAYPDKMYDYFVEQLDAQYKSYYSSYGCTDIEGFMKANNLELKSYVEDQMKYEMAIYTIADQQDIEITDEDIKTLLEKYNYNSKEELLVGQNLKPFELEEYILYNKVSAYLLSVAKAK